MPEPVIVPRAEHTISRRDIDPDALKVLYRLQQFNYEAYLVGGGVRDLLLGRRPKDFDIGTSAHPYQIKKLFRNCWIIGRRFRLAHVRFGPKAIEVATFRRNIPAGTENEAPADDRHGETAAEQLVRHDNTFGTPEEDAFRRDFTINALFYDIATFSIIDYVGGLDDLRAGLVRSIGDPNVRFQEDPVRMLRAAVMAARLDFRLDPPIVHAIREHRQLMALAAPARLIEEYYKILRSGAAEKTFRLLAEHRLLEPVTPELQRAADRPEFWAALAALDEYRRRFAEIPPALTNPVLLGSLLVPLGLMPKRVFAPRADEDEEDARPDEGDEEADDERIAARPRGPRGRDRRRAPKEPPLMIGRLPVARRDTDRLRQILALQGRLLDLETTPRAKRALMHRSPFAETLTWLEIHGTSVDVVEHWKGFVEAAASLEPGAAPAPASDGPGDGAGRRRRRRGRRRGGRRGRGGTPPEG
ncbi:MAG: polynucleotide adenylyltransferase PcnB [Vicinamibacterales bacterium]